MTVGLIILTKVVVATALAVPVEILRRRSARVEPAYALWAAVLAVLLIPSVVTVPVPGWMSAEIDSFADWSSSLLVVIPAGLLERLDDATLDSVLRHELIHLRRRDAWRRRLEIFVLSLWWWLPTAWIARRQLRELEELCVDAAVLSANPDGVEPKLWKLHDGRRLESDDQRVMAPNLHWIFGFLNVNNEIIDHEGTRHSQPDLLQLS